MRKKCRIILTLFILLIVSNVNVSNSTVLNYMGNYSYEEISHSFNYNEIDKLKERKIVIVKNKLRKYINDIDSSKYFHFLNDDHLLIMDSLMVEYRLPEDIYYRQKLRESWFIDTVVSSAGAVGYSQIMYDTYLFFKKPLDLKDPSRLDVNENLLVGAYYMRYLKDKVDGKYGNTLCEEQKWVYVLSSYNAGFGNHTYALRKFSETIDYVDFIMRYRKT